MKPASLLTILLTALITTFSCTESITDSRPRIIRAPQDMIWTADTLKGFDQYAQLIPSNLLVFSANDAWLVCWSDIARGLLWHFDGKSWKESNIAADVGGMRVNDIAGYSSSDLWACGYSGDEIFLAHYNGSKWTKYNTNGIKGELLDMCKDTEGNLWVCGRNGLIMKYDRAKWITNYIYLQKAESSKYWFNCVGFTDGLIHLSMSHIDFSKKIENYYYIHGNISRWLFSDSMIIKNHNSEIKWGYYEFNSSNNRIHSMGINGYWIYENGWQKKFSYVKSIYDAWESAFDYKIIVGESKASFYNGTHWKDFETILDVNPSLFTYKSVWTTGYETFIVGYARDDRLIVWRGK
ncbi:MAG: hypothetical protein FD143_2809 [Ignavibacteria bacterium]|nr:MAG: hypothetical protein FD143_2809 [Ignavibacteria bacterium]KAF0160183.1 MAG: hypothetical protein FD188_1997 [Ignavibacteria bacterium]